VIHCAHRGLVRPTATFSLARPSSTDRDSTSVDDVRPLSGVNVYLQPQSGRSAS
jgi:hypothetical protein